MSEIIRDEDDFPGGVILPVINDHGETVIVDKDEYAEMVEDGMITFPTGHSASAMTLEECFPGLEDAEL
jgi:hypothetical protein